ncbi:hypothetical protein HYS29_00730 [Candidatus Microgenomates bacterium]|nr:hypothetical protein [Candidatus Microgenomates bacterium]
MKSRKLYLLVIGVSLLPLISLFIAQDLIHTHDSLVHLPRIGAYYKGLLVRHAAF